MDEILRIVIMLGFIIVPIQLLFLYMNSKPKNIDNAFRKKIVSISSWSSILFLSCGLYMFTHVQIFFYIIALSIVGLALTIHHYRHRLVQRVTDMSNSLDYIIEGRTLERFHIGRVEWITPNVIWWDKRAAEMHGFKEEGIYTHQQWYDSVGDTDEADLAVAVGSLAWEDKYMRYCHTVRMPHSQILCILAKDEEKGYPVGFLVELPDQTKGAYSGGRSITLLQEFRNSLKNING